MGEREKSIELGSAELEVLNVLWDRPGSTVRQVMALLHENGRRVAYTTVLTFLTRLEQKGVVESDKSGLAYVYRATVSRDRIRRNRLRTLVEELYDGAAGPLVLQLIKTQKFSREEIEALQALIRDLDGKGK